MRFVGTKNGPEVHRTRYLGVVSRGAAEQCVVGVAGSGRSTLLRQLPLGVLRHETHADGLPTGGLMRGFLRNRSTRRPG